MALPHLASAWSLATHTARIRIVFLLLLVSSLVSLALFLWDTDAVLVDDLLQFEDSLTEPFVTVDTALPSQGPIITSPSNDNFYIALDLVAQHNPHHETTAPARHLLPLQCIEDIIATGGGCVGTKSAPTLDVVWSWVNSSDHIWRDVHTAIEQNITGKSSSAKVDYKTPLSHLRDYDELRYSMRSVLRHFKPYARRFHLLASDFTVPDNLRSIYDLPPSSRIGQVPQWLDDSAGYADWQDGDVDLAVHHHATFFDQYINTSFSSFGIESQIRNLQGVSDMFVYLNDDMYMLKDLHPADFYTTVYGPVFRFDPYLMVPPTLDPRPVRGEWQPLRESNVLLSKRFGDCSRPYTSHMAKTMSLTLLRELGATFPAAFARTGGRLLREVWRGAPGDIHTAFLLPHFVVERWREALLWAWAVARVGADDDRWDAAAVWAALAGGAANESVTVGPIPRDTLDADAVADTLFRAGYAEPNGTTYRFASGDGYPYFGFRHREKGYPAMTRARICKMQRDECFPRHITNASDAFRHLAFAKPSCGDCVINLLVQRSGRRGLSEFLPSRTRKFPSAARGPAAETLPIVSEWRDGAFALADVLHQAPTASVSVYDWTLRLLNRYRFVLGESPSEFVFLQTIMSTRKAISKLKPGSNVALACMNDDISGDSRKIAELLMQWQRERWPTPAQWENVL